MPTSEATSGDVVVDRDGNTIAGVDGVNAASTAYATTEVDSEVTQENESSGTATATRGVTGDPNDPTCQNTPCAPYVTQGQIVLQENLNGQIAVAESEATSGNVTVNSTGDTTSGNDGVNAHSGASSETTVDQDVDQSNDNSGDATAANGTVLQAQIVGQLNASGQFAFGEFEASSGDVSVTREGNTFADSDGDTFGDGIDASSTAFAHTDVEQEAKQENENSLDGDAHCRRPGAACWPIQSQRSIRGGELGRERWRGRRGKRAADGVGGQHRRHRCWRRRDQGRGEGGGQGRARSRGRAVERKRQRRRHERGARTPGLAAVDAEFFNIPFGGLINDIELFTFGLPDGTALQLDGVLQVNANLQAGVADADAYSGDVYVNQFGSIDAGGDGISADSKAIAIADLDQKAEQDNENEMTAGGPAEGDDPAETVGISGQGQLVGQLNLNLQAGASLAEAEFGDVTVYQDGALSSGDDSIDAESKAVAVAKLEQDADQDNENSAEAFLRNPNVLIGGAEPAILALPPLLIEGLGVQAQLVGQLNASAQLGLADASAEFGDVYVDSTTPVDPAVGTGIDAEFEGGGDCQDRPRCRAGERERGEHHLAAIGGPSAHQGDPG